MARDLRFYLKQYGLDTAELAESGLGYANLLYLAVVLVELQAAKDADLTLFLVEEPEAHLHPQLQALTLGYLRDQAATSTVPSPDGHEGRIQVVVTTHSPNLTAAVGAKHVVVVRRPVLAAEPSRGAGFASTTAVSVSELGLTEKSVAKIDRYLDVTRCALLFSRRVMLVEGMAEALLLPVLAQRRVLCDKSRAPALARFRAATLVPIEGVDFEPYLDLLLTAREGCRLADRVVVVTDEDQDAHRCDLLRAQGERLQASERLRLHAAKPTLEAELFAAGNADLLKDVFLHLRPKSSDRWETLMQKAENARPGAFVELLAQTRTRKGDFAQSLAERIAAGAEFAVPTYLTNAIQDLVADDA
ncbi:MAG: AAA family ATPase [Deltaproteobacteria bacterium]|nr:AAA family ATPase [Deltaproteobacteria bacterium]